MSKFFPLRVDSFWGDLTKNEQEVAEGFLSKIMESYQFALLPYVQIEIRTLFRYTYCTPVLLEDVKSRGISN